MKNTKLFFHLFLASILAILVSNSTQAQLKAGEGVTAKAFIGINYHHVSQYIAQEKAYPNKYGSRVVSTIEGTNAKSSGLLQGDYIIGINEYYTKRNFTLSDILKKYCPGDRVTLHVLRGENQAKDIDITLVESKLSQLMTAKPFLGVHYSELNRLGEESGAIVGKIEPNSSAEEMGMQKNDVIKEINGIALQEWNDLHEILQGINVGNEINIVFERAGQTLEGTTFIKNRANTYYNNCLPQEEAKAEIEETAEKGMTTLDPNTIQLYPNPSEDIFTLAFKMPEKKGALRILDPRGQVIYNEEIKAKTDSNFYQKEFNLGTYPKGIYFIQVNINGAELFTKKLVLR